MNSALRSPRVWLAVTVLGVGLAVLLILRLRQTDLTLTFTRNDLQKRVAEKFPLDQELLFLFTITYSNPVVKLEEGSDRIGIGLDASAKLASSKLVKGRFEADWQVRYDPAVGALYFDDPKIQKFGVEGLSPEIQETVAKLAKPFLSDYLRRVPVYRLKPGDLRQDLARGVIKSVSVRQGRLVVVVGAV